MFEILEQKRKHYPVINSEKKKHFQVKERGERVQETAPRKPKDEEGSTEIPVYVRETSLSSDGRARGYIECVREMEEFHFFASCISNLYMRRKKKAEKRRKPEG